jgi:hypothetical protein
MKISTKRLSKAKLISLHNTSHRIYRLYELFAGSKRWLPLENEIQKLILIVNSLKE